MTENLSPERALLGAVLSGYRDVESLMDIVAGSMFADARHEWIWQAIGSVIAAGSRPDAMTVQMAMDAKSLRMLPGGAIYLVDLAQACPVVGQAPTYARMVENAAGRAALIQAAVRVDALGRADDSDLDALREEARKVIDDATDAGVSQTTAVQLAEVLSSVFDIAQHGQAAALGTGWPDLDRHISGLAPGRVVTVGARPGAGKSIMGANLALHVAHHHEHAALLCSMEMPREEVTQRILAAHAGVDLTRLTNGGTDEREWGRIAKCTTELESLPLTIDDRPAQTLTSVAASIRNVQRSRKDLALVVVDYLQLMRARDPRIPRHEQVGELARGLKNLARESGTCIVMLAQVNRESVKAGKRPTMADLRESGDIEANSDMVLMLHQPDDEIPEVEVLVDKNRAGPRGGIVALQMQGHYARFSSVARASGRVSA